MSGNNALCTKGPIGPPLFSSKDTLQNFHGWVKWFSKTRHRAKKNRSAFDAISLRSPGRRGNYSVASWFTGFEVKLKATGRPLAVLIHLLGYQDFAAILSRNEFPQLM
jgi:hypothetical protein